MQPLDSDAESDDTLIAPQLLDLGDGILVLVALYLDVPSLSSFLRTNRRTNGIERNHGEFLWESRVVGQYGRILPMGDDNSGANPVSWKDFAKNLHHGVGDYHGFALDKFTSSFRPYPMHLNVIETEREARGTGHHHSLRWTTLRDSLTRVQITARARRKDASGVPDSVSFSEVELLRGRYILVPNHYEGWYCGPAMIGVYPGGSFFLLRREAIPTDRLHGVFLNGVDPSRHGNTGSSSVDCRKPHQREQQGNLRAGTKFVGAVTMELDDFSPNPFREIRIRYPKPVSAILELVVDRIAATCTDSGDTGGETMSSSSGRNSTRDHQEASTTYNGHIVVSNDQGDWFRIDASITVDGGKGNHQRRVQPFDVIVEVGSKAVRANDGDEGGNNGQQQQQPTGVLVPVCISVLQFMASSKLYGWFQGDNCIVGLLKDKFEARAGSFVVKLRDNSDTNNTSFITGGIKDHLAPSLHRQPRLREAFP